MHEVNYTDNLTSENVLRCRQKILSYLYIESQMFAVFWITQIYAVNNVDDWK
jgi:hypothetical protein